MKPAIVVDVGNSRIKWGRCDSSGITALVALPPDQPEDWKRQLDDWGLSVPLDWAVSGVHPARTDALVRWLAARGDRYQVIDRAAQLSLQVALERPDHVGIDRLFNALAAKTRHGGGPIVVVDAGSAVTVDYLDGEGVFRGGSIFPGFRLMTGALHEHTALLPLVRVTSGEVELPARSTIAAIKTGVFHAVAGGIRGLIEALAALEEGAAVYLTGGDAPLLLPALQHLPHLPLAGRLVSAPFLTLEGVRIAAEALA